MPFATNGQAVTFAVGVSWNAGQAHDIDWAREFRYDSARQRYMNAELDTGALEGGVVRPLSTTWSDYDGDSVYGDFEMIGGSATDVLSFEPGIGKFDWSGGSPVASSVQFYHTNQIGTTRFMTDSSGAGILPATYTAFGERIDGTNHRYGYAGAHGYQTHDDLPYLHVGHRYYDPATGRFLQRDSIGIRGGANVYAYMMNNPSNGVDPTGEGIWAVIAGTVGVIVGSALMTGGVINGNPILFRVGVAVTVISVAIIIADLNGIPDLIEDMAKPLENPIKEREKVILELDPPPRGDSKSTLTCP